MSTTAKNSLTGTNGTPVTKKENKSDFQSNDSSPENKTKNIDLIYTKLLISFSPCIIKLKGYT